MSLRELAKKALKTSEFDLTEFKNQADWDLKEEYILMCLEVDYLRSEKVDLSYENELLKSQNHNLQSLIQDLKIGQPIFNR